VVQQPKQETSHSPHPAPMLSMSEATPPLPHMLSWQIQAQVIIQGELYLNFPQ